MRFIQGYGDSLTLVTGYSVINLTFTDDRVSKIAMMEAAFGTGMIVGPSLGSFVYGMVGYQWTLYYFALQTFVFMTVSFCFVPSALNNTTNEADEERLLDNPASHEELKLLKGYNLICKDEVSVFTVLKDRFCFLAYFSTFLGTFAMEFFVPYLSLHLKK